MGGGSDADSIDMDRMKQVNCKTHFNNWTPTLSPATLSIKKMNYERLFIKVFVFH